MSVTTRLMLAVAMLGTAFAGSAKAQSPLGVWLDDTGRGAVEIVECGQGKLCGKLVWIKNSKNAKRCGTAILGEVGKAGSSWDNGWIYSPEKDAKYDVELTPSGTDKLIVLGYAGSKLFSKEMTWTRAPADLQRCDKPQIEARATAPNAPAVVQKAAPAAVAATGTVDVRPAPALPPKSGGAQMAAVPQAAAPPAVAAAPPAPQTADREKRDAEKWASEPEREGAVETAQADVAPETAVKPAAAVAKPRAKTASRKRKMCRVDAPFVTVDFPCDDDD